MTHAAVRLAAKAGMDPVEFRLLNLKDARMKRVLQAAAQKFGWTPKAAPSRRGVGRSLPTARRPSRVIR